MPIKKVKGGWKFGSKGAVHPTKEKAIKQMKAMYANGYKGSGKK